MKLMLSGRLAEVQKTYSLHICLVGADWRDSVAKIAATGALMFLLLPKKYSSHLSLSFYFIRFEISNGQRPTSRLMCLP